MSLLRSDDPRPVHFVGVGGAGMSALAELFAKRGVAVTGCDAGAIPVEDLARAGVETMGGHSAAHVRDARALVITSAMPKDHPELVAARDHGIPIVRRAEALGDAVNDGRVVAVAGTHGKTTTTVMTTEALAAAGARPTGVAGGRVRAWEGNLKYGGSDVFVVEADEYDRSFLALRPTIAVVTNVEADHLDIYRDLADIHQTFEQFLAPAHTVVLCGDDKGARALRAPHGAQILSYGLTTADARVMGAASPLADGGQRLTVTFDGEPLGAVQLRVPGDHNARNALAAVASGLALGFSLDAMRGGLESFGGVQRRFERLGEARDVLVIDDYAHHPTEVAATLHAARGAFPGRRILAAFQPHLFSRTRDFAEEFAAALARADLVFLADIYPAREAPMPGVTSALIADAMRRAHQMAPVWQGPRQGVAAAIAAEVCPGDVVLTLGAGDITNCGPELLRILASSTQ